MLYKNIFKDILLGLSVGDALGVPVEFKSREYLKQNAVTDMIGYGTYKQPAGTFSDDSSLAFCLAEVLTDKLDTKELAARFSIWLHNGYWTAHNEVFDVGIAIRQAIKRIDKGIEPELCGGFQEIDNGNGSLMRILPLLIHNFNLPIKERYENVKKVSSVTHAHIRSIIACFYYLEFAREIVITKNLLKAYRTTQKIVTTFFIEQDINQLEVNYYSRLFYKNISEYNEADIESSGYVLHTIEAAIWCLLKTSSYKDAVLKSVNLGMDTDTTSCVVGGLAGLFYGYKTIPKNWINQLARLNDIENLAERLENKYLL